MDLDLRTPAAALAATATAVVLFAAPAGAQDAIPAPGPPAAVIVPSRAAWADCTPHQVALHPNRIHVRCTASIAGIEYFALATDDAGHSARTLSLLTAAQVSGRKVHVLYSPRDTSGTAIGCLAADCRLILATVLE
jgi:hypothetical protein